MLDRFLALFVKHSQFMYLLIRPLKPLIIPNKKGAEAPNSKNGADSGFLLELFNKTLHPILTSVRMLPLYFEIENYISGVEK